VNIDFDEEIVGPRLWNIRPIRDLMWLAFWWCVLVFLIAFQSIFLPVAVAALLAYLFQPPIKRAEARWRWPRPLTATLIIVLFFLSLTFLFIGFWPLLQEQMIALGQQVPIYLQTAATRFGYDLSKLPLDFRALATKLENPSELIKEVFNRTGQAFDYLSRFLDVTSTILLNAVLIPIYFFFFAWHFDEGVRAVHDVLPLRHRDEICRIAKRMDESVAGFFRGRIVVSAIVVFLYALGWYLADVPYWFVLGILAGILNIIPYASGLFWPVAVLLKYVDTLTVHTSDGSLMSILVWPSVVFFVVQFIEGWVLTPWVQGEQMEMSVPTVLIVVFLGGAIGGFMGLLLCLPIFACLKILFQEFVMPRVRRWKQGRLLS
jgi:predicted PurR-regulated permease PerM